VSTPEVRGPSAGPGKPAIGTQQKEEQQQQQEKEQKEQQQKEVLQSMQGTATGRDAKDLGGTQIKPVRRYRGCFVVHITLALLLAAICALMEFLVHAMICEPLRTQLFGKTAFNGQMCLHCVIHQRVKPLALTKLDGCQVCCLPACLPACVCCRGTACFLS
jgi:hypothetical protein